MLLEPVVRLGERWGEAAARRAPVRAEVQGDRLPGQRGAAGDGLAALVDELAVGDQVLLARARQNKGKGKGKQNERRERRRQR